MVKEDYINNEEWDKITDLTRKSVDTMLDLKIAHIGINSENESVVKTISNVFSTIMDTDITKESDKRIFADIMFEVMKYNGVCDNGHIAIKTTNVAVSHANYGMNAQFVITLPDNAIAQAAERELRGLGVDISKIKHTEGRMGIYFLKSGTNLRFKEI